jgi:hypothetical protein
MQVQRIHVSLVRLMKKFELNGLLATKNQSNSQNNASFVKPTQPRHGRLPITRSPLVYSHQPRSPSVLRSLVTDILNAN